MTDEKKLYTIMVQAEELQEQAVKLQQGARTSFDSLSKAVEQAESRIMRKFSIGACVLIASAVVVGIITLGVLWWLTDAQRDELITLQRKTQEFEQMAGKAILNTCGGRVCIQVDERAGKYGTEDERYYIIEGY